MVVGSAIRAGSNNINNNCDKKLIIILIIVGSVAVKG